jgi:thioredoxin 1
MGKIGKIAVVVVLAVAVVGVIVMKKGGTSSPSVQPTTQAVSGLPRLVDLGSTTCIPCKMMAPILEELRKEYAGRMQVEFIDTNVNPDAKRQYRIDLIPTQVFIDASGQEIDRHVGFISKEDILALWQAHGIAFTPTAASSPMPPTAPAVKSGAT